MKNSLRLLIATLALMAGVSAFAQTTDITRPAHGPHFGPPPGVVNDDGTITLPDGTVINLSKAPPAGGPGRGLGGHRGPPPSGE